jgi:putative PIN family toxin of toxin-antitoxin system
MIIFIDTNIFLDALLNRDEGISKNLIQHLEKQDIEIYLSDITIINIAYIIRKYFSKNEIKEIINIFLKKHKIICANDKIIKNANHSKFNDFEDGIQYFCAKEIKADLIISNNKKDFTKSDIFVLSAKEFYNLYVKM